MQADGLLTIVTPAYNEAENLPHLYDRLSAVLDAAGVNWEWVVVDDHSSDDTFAVVDELSQSRHVRAVRLSRNSGSHIAILCGLHHARGDCAVVLAGDLQDPPAVLPDLIAQWQQGAQVVWAVRGERHGETARTVAFARMYYLLMRRVVGLKNMPPTGADFFLIDRCVIDALERFNDANVSIMALITWMGFRQAHVAYDKEARLFGQSGWTLAKKVKLAVDSVTSFSYLPIRLMSLAGVTFACAGLACAGVVLVGRLFGHVVAGTGYAAIMTVLLLGFGFLMTFLGVLGEYVWRTLDEARRRPRYLIERITGEAERWGDDPVRENDGATRHREERRATP